MPMVATQKPYTLFLMPDSDPVNPRVEWDNFGTMVCFHSRYALGDKHNYSNAEELFQKLVQGSIPAEDVISYVKDGNVDGLKLEYKKSNYTPGMTAISPSLTLVAPFLWTHTFLS